MSEETEEGALDLHKERMQMVIKLRDAEKELRELRKANAY